MRVLITSANSLFSEVLAETLSATPEIEVDCVEPEKAPSTILESTPDVIVVDEMMQGNLLPEVLNTARKLNKSRVILLNPNENQFVVLQSEKAILRKVDDLMSAINVEME